MPVLKERKSQMPVPICRITMIATAKNANSNGRYVCSSSAPKQCCYQ